MKLAGYGYLLAGVLFASVTVMDFFSPDRPIWSRVYHAGMATFFLAFAVQYLRNMA